MRFSRRQFLQAGGGLAALSFVGCGDFENIGLDTKQLSAGLIQKKVSDAGPFTAPDGELIDLYSHILNRLTFGSRPGDYARVQKMGTEAFIEEQLAPARIEDEAAQGIIRRFETLSQPTGELFEYKEQFLLREMTRASLLRATYSRRQLYEVMVTFWTDHFNINSSKGDCRWLKAADDRDVIRPHALGHFSDLLRASALSPAMLWYLDGRVNKKAKADERPNENYARELLELHTLGIGGGYTQSDVMEIARCLTGWTVRSGDDFNKGKVEFKPELHDDGAKVVLGEKIPSGQGSADLQSVLNLVARHPSTARHIATKLCGRFISDEPPASAVAEVADAFIVSRGGIRETLRALFTTSEFREARGVKFKRPMEFIVSALRATGAETDAPQELTNYLLRMGHAPFQYPTPDGYPQEAEPWMGGLLWRWHFAAALAGGKIPGTKIELVKMKSRFGGDDALLAHLLGRRPTQLESEACLGSGAPAAEALALALASPGFQRC